MSSALIDELCGDGRPNGKGWFQGLLSLLFLFLLAAAISGEVQSPYNFRARECIVSAHPAVRFPSVPADGWKVTTTRKGLLL